MNILAYFCLDLKELKNCKAELSINSHIEEFENLYFFDKLKELFNDHIKTIKTLVVSEQSLKNYHLVDFLRIFQNIKVCFFHDTFI